VDGVSRRMVRGGGGGGGGVTVFEGAEAVEYRRDAFVPIEMAAGDCIALHGALVHMSLDNESEESRHAFSIHLVDGLETYSPRGWLQRPPELPFRRLDDPPPLALPPSAE
jgi:phytanoyl-CoA hydroxylase